MGFFDKLKSAKENYDRKEAEKRQAIEEEFQRRKREEEEKERVLYEKLENSELIHDLVNWISTKKGFAVSQGGLDTNCRHVLVGTSVILLDNYDSDILVKHIEWICINNRGQLSYRIGEEKMSQSDSRNPNHLYKVTLQETLNQRNEWILRTLGEYEENERYYRSAYSLKMNDYECIEGESMLKAVATVLRNQLQKIYPDTRFGEVCWNGFCGYTFEMNLVPVKKKSIL